MSGEARAASDAGADADVNAPDLDAPDLDAPDVEEAALVDGGDGPAVEADPISVEDLLETLEATTAQRDEYLEALQRLQAEFANFRKRTMADTSDRVAAGVGRLAEALLPVLDACDAAVAAGESSVGPIAKQLADVLGKEGLERIPAVDHPFDPEVHEAVMHEPGDSDAPVVSEELRSGYTWAGRVLRPAMVKVRG